VTGAGAEIVSITLLAITIAVAVVRPLGASEGLVAVPAALAVVALGIVPQSAAAKTLREIGPTVGFLAAILVLGQLCAEARVFDYLGSVAARSGHGDMRRLLGLVVAIAAGVTVVLTLDATVVLLTPVVLVTAVRLKVPVRPFAYACTRLANSGSLLLPVSNLTNLLAFGASGLSFGRFTALTLLPWVVACVGEWAALRLFFAADLERSTDVHVSAPVPAPRFALVVLGLTVTGFVVTSSLHVAPAWAALAGCVVLLAGRLRGGIDPIAVVRAASPGFCAFVLALAVVVDGVTRHGLHRALAHLVPHGTSFPALLALAIVAAVLANLVNNLPATLVLVPLVAGNPALVLAVLLGVNIGPNATYAGSLATMLWRRMLPQQYRPSAGEFHLLGALTVPGLLVATSGALWVSLQVVGI
jgi:arsenical pump membrane protein